MAGVTPGLFSDGKCGKPLSTSDTLRLQSNSQGSGVIVEQKAQEHIGIEQLHPIETNQSV